MKAIRLRVLIYYFYFTHDEYLTEDRVGAKYVKKFVNKYYLNRMPYQGAMQQQL